MAITARSRVISPSCAGGVRVPGAADWGSRARGGSDLDRLPGGLEEASRDPPTRRKRVAVAVGDRGELLAQRQPLAASASVCARAPRARAATAASNRVSRAHRGSKGKPGSSELARDREASRWLVLAADSRPYRAKVMSGMAERAVRHSTERGSAKEVNVVGQHGRRTRHSVMGSQSRPTTWPPWESSFATMRTLASAHITMLLTYRWLGRRVRLQAERLAHGAARSGARARV
jgi:hypothetical protein